MASAALSGAAPRAGGRAGGREGRRGARVSSLLALCARALAFPAAHARSCARARSGPNLPRLTFPPARSYLLPASSSGLPHDCVFTGDTLFAAGCGRFFEGDAAQMLSSLGRLAALAPETRVYCGHEYTVSNLHFCLHVEPGNARTAARLEEARAARAAGRPTLPSTIADERATNVFMRTASEDVRAWAGAEASAGGDVAVMARLREAKNAFKAPPA